MTLFITIVNNPIFIFLASLTALVVGVVLFWRSRGDLKAPLRPSPREVLDPMREALEQGLMSPQEFEKASQKAREIDRSDHPAPPPAAKGGVRAATPGASRPAKD